VNAVRATFKNGQIVPSEPIRWPEGTELLVEPLPREQTVGIREEDWQTDPEAVADWLRWYESLEPLEFTADEEADIAAWRQKVKELSSTQMDKRIKGLF
jgi:hypothetical protein